VRLIDAPSPNFDARQAPPDMIVLHYTGMQTGEAALARLRDPAAGVSAHYVVEEDGRVFSLVGEARRAWHAGVSAWKGVTDINGRSIGVEIVNPGHEFGYRPFPPAQIEAVIALIGDVRSRWTIDDALILAHSDIAPPRQQDRQIVMEGPGRGRSWPVNLRPARGAARAPGTRARGTPARRTGWPGYGTPPATPSTTTSQRSRRSSATGCRADAMGSPTVTRAPA
jgi:hypothetical protein